MDWKVLLMGATPPLMAILAEWLNPVCEETLGPAAGRIAMPLVRDDVFTDYVERETAINQIATSIQSFAGDAVEVAAVIPTWISVTSGITAALIDHVPPVSLLLGLVFWLALLAMVGMKMFATCNYGNLGDDRRHWLVCPGGTSRKCLSFWLIVANALVIVVVIISVFL